MCDSGGSETPSYLWIQQHASSFGIGLYNQLHSRVPGECNHVEASGTVVMSRSGPKPIAGVTPLSMGTSSDSGETGESVPHASNSPQPQQTQTANACTDNPYSLYCAQQTTSTNRCMDGSVPTVTGYVNGSPIYQCSQQQSCPSGYILSSSNGTCLQSATSQTTQPFTFYITTVKKAT